jgi:hypothetical protein
VQQHLAQQGYPFPAQPQTTLSSSFPPKGPVDIRAPAPTTPSKYTAAQPAAVLPGTTLPKVGIIVIVRTLLGRLECLHA